MQQGSTVSSRVSTPRTHFARMDAAYFKLRLSPSAFFVLSAILLDHFSDGACKDVRRLMQLTNLKRAYIYKALGQLRAAGVLTEIEGRLFVSTVVDKNSTVVDTGFHPGGTPSVIYIQDYRQQTGGEMGKIIKGTLRRTAPTAQRDSGVDDEPRAPDTIVNLQTWAEVKFAFHRDLGPAQRARWKDLLAIYGNDALEVQAACERANAIKSQLVSDKFPKFTLTTILFYAKYKDKSTEPIDPEHIAYVKEMIAVGNIESAANAVEMYGMRRKDLRGIDEQHIVAMYAILGHGESKTGSKHSGFV